MTREEFDKICKWMEYNANSSKYSNVYEMLERFRIEFFYLLKDELSFNKGVWATIQCLAIDHRQPICASFVANDMGIHKSEAQAMQNDSGYYDALMEELMEYFETIKKRRPRHDD